MSDPIEGMAAALNDAWLGRAERGFDWAWTCKHQPTIAGECRQRARAAWAYALAALLEEAGGNLRVREFLALTAGRHGIELPASEPTPPEPLPAHRTPGGHAL